MSFTNNDKVIGFIFFSRCFSFLSLAKLGKLSLCLLSPSYILPSVFLLQGKWYLSDSSEFLHFFFILSNWSSPSGCLNQNSLGKYTLPVSLQNSERWWQIFLSNSDLSVTLTDTIGIFEEQSCLTLRHSCLSYLSALI